MCRYYHYHHCCCHSAVVLKCMSQSVCVFQCDSLVLFVVICPFVSASIHPSITPAVLYVRVFVFVSVLVLMMWSASDVSDCFSCCCCFRQLHTQLLFIYYEDVYWTHCIAGILAMVMIVCSGVMCAACQLRLTVLWDDISERSESFVQRARWKCVSFVKLSIVNHW